MRAPHEQPIFISVFEKNLIFSGANRVSAAFQLRFSYVSAQLRALFLFGMFGLKIFAFLKVKLLVKFIFLCFSGVSVGKNGVLTFFDFSLDLKCTTANPNPICSFHEHPLLQRCFPVNSAPLVRSVSRVAYRICVKRVARGLPHVERLPMSTYVYRPLAHSHPSFPAPHLPLGLKPPTQLWRSDGSSKGKHLAPACLIADGTDTPI